jgi:3-oxoacyl-[acyl-carrier protein] reductase
MNPADGENADFQKGLTALGTYGRGEDIAAMVSFLAGDGGRNVTGALLAVDGGVNA